MPFLSRLRRPGTRNAGAVALTVVIAALLAACGQDHPDSIFHQRTDVNRDVDYLFKILIYAGTAVFIFVEGILVWTLIKFRKRPGQPEPEHVHGNTTLEIAWTVIPLIILIIIAIPTVQSIFKTQAVARSDALQVEVYGHQWWWEFRYPQYTMRNATSGKLDTVVTANELYLPLGKTVNFTLKSRDVIHSFWVPALSGKRDVIPNRTNYLWYTPDSATASAWNGACVEYCGTSHANMRFKAFTVTPADFDSWIAHQEAMAEGTPAVPAAPPTGAPAVVDGKASGAPAGAPASASAVPTSGAPARLPATPAVATPGAGVPTAPGAVNAQVVQTGYMAFPREKLPANAIPQTPNPAALRYDDNVLTAGNSANGEKLVSTGMCTACHTIRGERTMVGVIGPNLTHVATRTTIAAGMYPNDARHLARWIKNPSEMKPGVIMPSFGIGEYDPTTKARVKTGFTDQQIADVVAYLLTLK